MTRPSTLCAAALAAVLIAAGANAATLSFEQVLARVEATHGAPSSASTAADFLEGPQRRGLPTLKIETSATTSKSVDFLAQNVFRYDALTALLSVDFPLIDGGMREKQIALSRLDARAFRERMRESSDELFRETVDAVSRLYTVQERRRILTAGLLRVVQRRDRAAQLLAENEISNLTAAQWQDEAFAAESQLLELELRQLEASSDLKRLMGDASGEPIEIALDLEARLPNAIETEAPSMMFGVDRAKLALEEAEAARKLQVTMSAFGGITSFSDVADDGGYGIFGIRFTVALPMFDGALARRVAEARLRAEQAAWEQRTLQRRQASMPALDVRSLEQRIDLLTRMLDVAKRREESLARLAEEGVRPENEVADAATDRARRESELLGARVELWKAAQLATRRSAR